MSAFIVSELHINAIVSAAADIGAGWSGGSAWKYVKGNEQEVAEILLKANIDNHNQMYPSEAETDFSIEFERINDPSLIKNPVQVAKLCDCLEYQCSDSPDWHTSVAREILCNVREYLWRKQPGYENLFYSI